MGAYSQDLRDRVLNGLARGERPRDIANRLEVTSAWVCRVRKRLLETGGRSSLPVGGYRRPRLTGMESQIRAWIRAEPGLTLMKLCERLREHGIMIKITALWNQLDKWGLTLKKDPERQQARALTKTAGEIARLD
jgi:transposase